MVELLLAFMIQPSGPYILDKKIIENGIVVERTISQVPDLVIQPQDSKEKWFVKNGYWMEAEQDCNQNTMIFNCTEWVMFRGDDVD